MAGDWIKIEENMPDKPEVAQIASALGIESDSVVGRLIRVWAWASRNCNADGVTSVTVIPLLNRVAGVTGFAEAMEKSGWLVIDNESLRFPNFDRHCSETAKERANTNRRVAKHRVMKRECNGESVTNVTVAALEKPLPEKRREEKSITETPISPLLAEPKAEPVADKSASLAPSKSELQLRAEKLHGKREATPWDRSEVIAWKQAKATVEATSPEEWQALEAFYAAPQAETFARKALAQTLNNWAGEISKAKAWQKSQQTEFVGRFR